MSASINVVVLAGRLTRDPTLNKTATGVSVCSFSLACDRPGSNDQNGQHQTDFIDCVALRQSAEYLSTWAHKGDMIGVEGSIRKRSYQKDDQTIWVTEVHAGSVSIVSHKQNG